MIHFNDGTEVDAIPYFDGNICTIYDIGQPNTSGFSYDGLDLSDFTTIYRIGDGFYQLSNNNRVCENENETVQTKEKIEEMEAERKVEMEVSLAKEEIEKKKSELQKTDYVIIKQMEGLDMSQYDMETIKKSRQALRDEINSLESNLYTLMLRQEGGI